MDNMHEEFYQPTPKEAQVWRVCDALYAENKRLTYQSIGERLLKQGLKRGSNTDLCRYLASWKKYHYPKVAKKTLSSAPKSQRPISSNRNFENLDKTQSDIHKKLDNLIFEQKRVNKILQTQVGQKKQPQGRSKLIALLIDMIKKQQERESHYLKALEHARAIQKALKKQLDEAREISHEK